MGFEIELAKKAENIARGLSIRKHGTEALWESYLTEAYNKLRKSED
ncbi:MAG: hypothetical protein PVJ60_03955 [Phycisphaerales bacterium]|jgi:hypothetical protein